MNRNTIMMNKTIPLYAMRAVRLLAIVGAAVLVASCTRRPFHSKASDKDTAATAVSDDSLGSSSASTEGGSPASSSTTAKTKSAIPSWLVGTWSGQYADEGDSMIIHFIVVIKSDGTILQSSGVRGEDTEILRGKFKRMEDDNMAIQFDGEPDEDYYYVDAADKRISFNGNDWMTKR
jgi:hypothetical protein